MDDSYYVSGNRQWEKCYCEHCRTEGEAEQDASCLYWGNVVLHPEV